MKRDPRVYERALNNLLEWKHAYAKGLHLPEIKWLTVMQAIRALKKQIPKDVIRTDGEATLPDYMGNYECPHCGGTLIIGKYRYDYCDLCGQRLKWEDKAWQGEKTQLM